jgi:Uma2 family endonuclease
MTVDASASSSGSVDVDAFMAFAMTRPDGEDWELIGGVAVMRAPATFAQRRIAFNLGDRLNAASAAKHLDAYAYVNVAVRIPGVWNVQLQPDVAVVPGVATNDFYSERFQLAAEVLPPTNTREGIDLKLGRYWEAPDNLYAVVIDPREFMVEIYSKSRKWEPVVFKRPDDAIEMPEFGLHCFVADLYRSTPLDPRQAG